jgi:hypothetical protein
MLDHLEWRDLERMMARVMEGLGFKVTLTPPSKDGGKDLILTFLDWDERDEQSLLVSPQRIQTSGHSLDRFLNLVFFSHFYRTSRKIFWFDELFTVYLSRRPDFKSVWQRNREYRNSEQRVRLSLIASILARSAAKGGMPGGGLYRVRHTLKNPTILALSR